MKASQSMSFNKFQQISLHDDLQKQDNPNFNINTNFHQITWVNKIIIITILAISLVWSYFFLLAPSVSNKEKGELQKHINSEIFQILKKNVYYDIHYFINDQHSSQSQLVVASPPIIQAKIIQQKRQLIQITQSEQQMQHTIHQMMVPTFFTNFIASFYKLCKKSENLPHMYFANALSKQPQKKQYLQAEFYKFDKEYDIGSYGDQLPFCILVSGRNDVDVVEKMYQSIKKQNYSNYFVIHVDDASTDGTPEKVLQFLDKNPEMAKKVKMVTQPFRKNAIFNRDLGIRKYCREDDIVIDADADDWLIGRQVFQLVNTLYQKKHIYKGQEQQIWAIYFNNIANTRHFGLPVAFYEQQITEEQLQRSMYRVIVNWRTTLLRTYRKKLYMKVDINDFVDKVASKPGQFFVEQYDAFMHFPMVEMSGFKHMKIIDEFVYFYNVNIYNNKDQAQNFYSSLGSQTLPPYYPIQSLDEEPKRNYEFNHPKQYVENFEKRKKEVEEKRKILKQRIEKQLLKTGYKFNNI